MTIGRVFVRASACSAAIAVACAVSSQAAAEFEYETSLGAGHSDNIRRTATNEEDDSIAAPGLRFSLDRQSPRLQADAVGDLAYMHYVNGTFDSEVQGNLAGNARMLFVPQRFEWVISDNFGQVLTDPFVPPTPETRENINYFATGPDVTAAFGSQTRLRLSARYSLTTYEDSPLDSDGVSGQLALIRQLSGASALSLNASVLEVSYDEAALNEDYEQTEAFIRYDATGARTHLAIDAGYAQLDRDAVADTEGGLVFRLDASRRLSSSSTAVLRAGREFSNSANAFAATQDAGSIGQQPGQGLQTSQPFTNDYASLGWSFSRNRTGFSLGGSWSDQSYEDATQFDQTLLTFYGEFTRELSQQLALSLRALYSRDEFELANSDYDELNATMALRWRLSRNVSLGVTYDYFDRSSDNPINEYTENRFWLSVSYGRGTPRDALAGPRFGVDQGI